MASPPGRRAAPRVFGAALMLLGALAGGAHLRGRGRIETDDARVEGRLVPVTPRVSGLVLRVPVRDHELVEAGALLVELDPQDLEVRALAARAELAAAQAGLALAQAQRRLTRRGMRAGLEQAEGGVQQAEGGLGAARSDIDRSEAERAAAAARLDLARRELSRAQLLSARGAAAPAELEARTAQHEQAQAALRQAEARLSGARLSTAAAAGALAAARGRLDGTRGGRQQRAAEAAQEALAAARLQQAEAALRGAELALSYAQVRAPVRGLVSRRSVEVGALVGPERPLLLLVPPDDVWIAANFKEDQIAAVRPGLRARVRIDAYEGTLPGHVESVAGATSGRFALLPPDNAAGHFVKVTQRVPVLLRLDAEALRAAPLRPGMSAVVTVFAEAPEAP